MQIERTQITNPKKFKELVPELIKEKILQSHEIRDAWSIRQRALDKADHPHRLFMHVCLQKPQDRNLTVDEVAAGASEYREAHPELSKDIWDIKELRKRKDREDDGNVNAYRDLVIEELGAEAADMTGAEARDALFDHADAQGWEKLVRGRDHRWRKMDAQKLAGTFPDHNNPDTCPVIAERRQKVRDKRLLNSRPPIRSRRRLRPVLVTVSPGKEA